MTCSNNGCDCEVKELCQIRIKYALKGYRARTCMVCSALPTTLSQPTIKAIPHPLVLKEFPSTPRKRTSEWLNNFNL
jgi:hypothetical protein